jgi:hypothetical protein
MVCTILSLHAAVGACARTAIVAEKHDSTPILSLGAEQHSCSRALARTPDTGPGGTGPCRELVDFTAFNLGQPKADDLRDQSDFFSALALSLWTASDSTACCA